MGKSIKEIKKMVASRDNLKKSIEQIETHLATIRKGSVTVSIGVNNHHINVGPISRQRIEMIISDNLHAMKARLAVLDAKFDKMASVFN